MSNVLIASLGDSPVVVSTMYDLLTKQEHIQLDRIRILCPQVDKIDTSYLLVDEALNMNPKEQRHKLTIEREELDFEDADTYVRSIKFLSRLYALLEKHEQQRDTIYLSLAGGRKSMAALMAWVVPFFPCIKGLYHVIDPDEKHFLNIAQLQAKHREAAFFNYMRLPQAQLAKLKLVKIPCAEQQHINTQLRQKLLDIDLNNVAEEHIGLIQTFREVAGKDRGLNVTLSQRAHEQYQELCQKDVQRARKFKKCFDKMRSSERLKTVVHEWGNKKGQEQDDTYEHFHFFKLPSTAERPVFYTKPVDVNLSTISQITDIIVCELEVEKIDRKNDKYRSIKEIVDSPRFNPKPAVPLENLPAIKSDAGDTLIIPLGKRPMIATQLYTLLQEREQRHIKKTMLVYPAKNISISTSCSLIKNVLSNKVEVKEEPIPNIDDIDDTETCLLYQQALERVIERAQQENTKGEVLLSLSGGRKGMTAQTIFAAQNKGISYIYHTLINDEELSERIDEETTIKNLQRIGKSEQKERMLLQAYAEHGSLSKFSLFKVPVFSNNIVQ